MWAETDKKEYTDNRIKAAEPKMAAQLFLLQTLNKPVTVLENSFDVCGQDQK